MYERKLASWLLATAFFLMALVPLAVLRWAGYEPSDIYVWAFVTYFAAIGVLVLFMGYQKMESHSADQDR